jgi:hypothetical protein
VRPQEAPVALNVPEGLVDLPDAPPDHAPVGLELRLTGSPRPDTASEALEVGPLPDQPRQEIRELRQLDLELALARPRPLREDVEDQRGPIDDPHIERAREVSLLDRGQGIVGDEQPRPQRPGQRPDLLDLALPEVQARVLRAPLLDDAGEHLRPGALGQAGELLHGLLHLPAFLAGEPEAHEDRPVNGVLQARHAQSA